MRGALLRARILLPHRFREYHPDVVVRAYLADYPLINSGLSVDRARLCVPFRVKAPYPDSDCDSIRSSHTDTDVEVAIHYRYILSIQLFFSIKSTHDSLW